MGWAIVQTDNYNGDYPAEEFVTGLPSLSTKEEAMLISVAINSMYFGAGGDSRYWKVVELPYKLQPGFEP